MAAIDPELNCRKSLSMPSLKMTPFSAMSIPSPLRGCNSDLAQYSNTPARNASRSDAGGRTLQHSNTPSLHHSITPRAGFEDEDDDEDEDENEARQCLVTVSGLCPSDPRFCGQWRIGSNSGYAPC